MNSPELHFIISAPRSGSTWLAAALNRHPEIFATEHRLFGNFCELWPNNNGKLAPRLTFDSYAQAVAVHYSHDQIAESRSAFINEFIGEYACFLVNFAQRKTGKRIIVDKITPYPGTSAIVMAQLLKFFPDSKIIKLVRDGRDVLTSGAFDWMLKDAQNSPRHALFVERNPDIELARFFDDELIKKWATNWHETLDIFADFSPAMAVRYEELLTGMPLVLSEIFELLQTDHSQETANQCSTAVTFEKMTGRPPGQMDPTAKQRSGTSGDWQNYFTRPDGELFHSIAGQRLIQEGYVADATWIESLPESLSISCDQKSQGVTRR